MCLKLKLFPNILLLMLIIGCAGMGTNINDPKWLDTRVRERQKDFYTDLLANKTDELWNMRSSDFKAIFKKSDYVEYLKGKSDLAGYYNIEDSVENVEIKDKKAKVTIKHIEQPQKDTPVTESILYDYWVFEGSDWYLLEGGSLSSIRADW